MGMPGRTHGSSGPPSVQVTVVTPPVMATDAGPPDEVPVTAANFVSPASMPLPGQGAGQREPATVRGARAWKA